MEEGGSLGQRVQSGPQATAMYACMPEYTLQTGRVGPRRTQAGTLPFPQPHAPRMNQGQLLPGAPPPPPPSLVPKYFPPSQSSWDRKIPRASGPALPATASRPPKPVTNALPNGPRLSTEAPWAGPQASRQPGLPSRMPPVQQPPTLYPSPSAATITTVPTGHPQRLAPSGGRQDTGKWVGPAAHQSWWGRAVPGRGE